MIAAAAVLLATALTAPAQAAIDKLVVEMIASNHVAGATIAVAVNGEVAYEKAYGYADAAARVSASNDTVYPIGSITKQFTAACVLLLAQDGKLSIDDPLSRYVPGLPWGGRVTLRHLLDQESGVVDFRLGVIDYSKPMTETTVLGRLKDTDLLFPPGSKYEYSNSNYYLLGMVVENVSGKPYSKFLQERIFGPVGLKSTYYNSAGAGIAKLAIGNTVAANGPQPVTPENADWAYAAGAIASTASDLTRWDEALQAGPLLNDELRREMFAPGILDDSSPTDYAFGWVVVKHDGHREVWHNGEISGFHAMNAVYPDERTEVVVLTNTGGTYAADQLAVKIFDVLHPLAPSAADRAAIGRAKEWLGRIERGDVDRTQLTDPMNAVLTGSVIKLAGSQLSAFGRMKSIALASVDQDASGRNYSFQVTFAKQTIRWVMGIDATGKISALFFHV